MEPQPGVPGGTKIRLHGSSHQGTIFSILDKLLISETLVDVTLAAEGKFIRAHKVILSACSPYFQDLLSIDSAKHPIIFMSPDVKFNDMRALLNYMYTGETHIQQDNLPTLLRLAEAFQIRGLAETDDMYRGNSLNKSAVRLHPPVGNIPTSSHCQIPVLLPHQSPDRPEDYGRHHPINSLPREEDSHSRTLTHPGIQLVDPLPILTHNQQLINDPSTSSSSTNSRGIKRTARESNQPAFVPIATTQLNLPTFPISTPAPIIPIPSISQPLVQHSKRVRIEENFMDPLDSPQAVTEGAGRRTSQEYSFIDESSQDRLDLLKSSIKIEEGPSSDTIPEEIVISADTSEEHQMLSNQSWQLQDTSNQGDVSQMSREENAETLGGNSEGLSRNDHYNMVMEMSGDQSEYPCPACDKIYKTKSSLSRHIRYECNLPPTFKCSYCEVRMKLKSNLRAHERRHENQFQN